MDDETKQLENDIAEKHDESAINDEQAMRASADRIESIAKSEDIVKVEKNDEQTEDVKDIRDNTAQDQAENDAIEEHDEKMNPEVKEGSINAMPESHTATSDLDIIRAQIEGEAELQDQKVTDSISTITENGAATSGPQEELQRLRQLVLATRGSKGQLPAGWDDNLESEEVAQVEQTQHAKEEKKSEDLIESALKKVDATQVPDSEEEDESDSDSSSDDSSSSSSSSDSVSSSGRNGRRKRKVVMGPKFDLEDDGEGGPSGAGGKGPATKNEVIEPTLDAPPYTLVPEGIDIRPLGKIHSIVDSVVVVSQDTGKAPGAQNGNNGYLAPPVDRSGKIGEQEGEYSVLDTGSVLAFEDRNVLGVVYETFGSVQAPLYALRYASSAHVNHDQIQLGKPVYYVPNGSSYILTRALRAMGKGSDASNIWDEEIGDDEQEFSDDEAEAAYKKSQKVKRSGNNDKDGGKGKKRNAENAFAGQHGAQTNGKASVIRHSLPARPVEAVMQPAMHRDADFSSTTRSMPLPYDDDQQTSSSYLPGLEVSYESNMQSYPVGAPSYQHIRPRGGSSHGMRGRGRGNGRGGMTGHINPTINTTSSPAAVPGWNVGMQLPQMVQQQQQQPQQNQWPAQGYQQQQWQSSYGQSQQQQTYMTNPQMQQYTGYPATQGYPAYNQIAGQHSVDSTNSYDPSKPLFPYAQQQQQQPQQSSPTPQYSYGQQGWSTYPYQSQNGSPQT